MKQDRMARVNRLLQSALSEIVPYEVRDPRVQGVGLVVVVAVRATPDLRHAKIYVAIHAEERLQADALAGLKKASAFLRGLLANRIDLKNVPQLHFELDPVADNAAKIDKILKEISNEQP